MKLESPLYFAELTEERPNMVWINPGVQTMQLEHLPIVRVDDTDQLLDMYRKLNKMRMSAEEKVFELEERIRELNREIADRDGTIVALKARLYDLTGVCNDR